MMISRRPVSSPGQVEKYPPPFMGFLKSNSNGGSRSRSRSKGRSRASPLFVRRNKSAAAAVSQEPSSPKVTCMGQVRVKRSKPNIQPESHENPTRKRCEWIRNGLAGKIKTSSFWPKWKLFTFPCSRRKEKDSPVNQFNRPVTESSVEVAELNEDEEEENFKIFIKYISKSAPYSSSSLAFRFWEENNEREAESRIERERNVRSEVTVGATGKMNGVNEPEANIGGDELGIVRRRELTRSKSAPARIGEKMVCFWMKKKVRQGLGLSRD
ncbi:hypothetical protein IGI04_004324 [Brassica rapa subsp. trilocularis]|uniref:Uncharacterized protein n=1 Tax=Brassica rapa subsp. trilocularis TaxID=1813537 RepID=A0ABQ7NAS3_BRACM|nr:hypothetical protein IGI04_004324 [Brassica rapa subsp. trilocularis]